MKRVLTPSILITYPPNSRKFLKGISCYFQPFLYWIKEKSWWLLISTTIVIKRKTTKSILPPYHNKVRMCVDYRDLNRESPKGDFPLPYIDVFVNNTAQHKVFSFMDGFSGYNQIKMAPEDMEKTTFVTHWACSATRLCLLGWKTVAQHINMLW